MNEAPRVVPLARCIERVEIGNIDDVARQHASADDARWRHLEREARGGDDAAIVLGGHEAQGPRRDVFVLVVDDVDRTGIGAGDIAGTAEDVAQQRREVALIGKRAADVDEHVVLAARAIELEFHGCAAKAKGRGVGTLAYRSQQARTRNGRH